MVDLVLTIYDPFLDNPRHEFIVEINNLNALPDEQIQEHAETMRLKAIKFLTEARLEARS